MPRVTDLKQDPIKLLFMADSGFGKTGALAALANAGYTVVIFDFDNGAQILNDYLTEEAAQRVFVRPYTDEMYSDGLNIRPYSIPTAYSDFVNDLRGFEDSGVEFPSIDKWGLDHIGVVDSTTMMGQACLRYTLKLNIGAKEDGESQRRWQHPYPADYGEAQDLFRRVLELLYSDKVKTNIIFNSHIRFLGGGGYKTVEDKASGTLTQVEVDSEAEGKAIPTIIGKALGPEAPRYFNTVITGEYEGSGLSMERIIVTRDMARFPLRNERPKSLPQRLPLETGLLTIFQELRK